MSSNDQVHDLTRVLKCTALSALIVGAAGAQTVTVTTTADDVDISGFTGTVADLPGPDGLVSLSEAMIATNNTPGHQTVAFAIPASELGWFGPTYQGIAVFHALTGYYWHSSDEVTIDGTTQTAFAGDTNPNGAEIQLYGNSLSLSGPNSALLGFHSGEIYTGGANTLVSGNTGGMHINVSGDGTLVTGNEAGTIKVNGGNQCVITGNTMQRVRIWGATGTRVGGPNLADRNFITGYGTWNSEGYPSGKAMEIASTTGTLVENNWIGTTPDGLSQGNQACIMGISFEGSTSNAVVRNNRIAGILGHGKGPHAAGYLFGYGILIAGSGDGVDVVGNTIGLNANDEPVLGSVWGISIGDVITSPSSVTGVRIGGPNPGEGNVVAGHIFNGITVGRDVSQVRIQQTEFHSNGWQGIDLVPTGYGHGVTPNDPLDVDTGGNGLQNFPVVATAHIDGGGALRITGALNSSPLDVFTLEFYASPACEESGFGEGEVFLGTTSVTTDAAGDASFDVSYVSTVPEGWVVTSTATLEPLGATSEHSACATITGPHCQRDIGFGGPGTATLSVCGDVLASGGTADLAVVGTPAFAGVWVGFGVTSNPTPIAGGTFVPFPPALVWALGADASGEAHLAIPGGGFAAHTVYAQAVYVDTTLPTLIGFTNAVGIEILL